MNTDDLQVLARRADSVLGREATRLPEVHDRIRAVRRRTQLRVALALVVLLVAGATVIAFALRPLGDPDPAPPVHPSPSPTETARLRPLYVPPKGTKELSLRQTVLSYNAGLVAGMATPDDPDVRLSVWFTRCGACREDYRRGLYWAMALTRDGYRTTRYLPLPGIGNVPQISSPAPGLFLLGDAANGAYWLLDADGSPKPVTIVAEPRPVADPRLVFRCLSDTPEGAAAVPDHAAGRSWCVLDVKSATAAPLQETWAYAGTSDGDPRLGQGSWGQQRDAVNGPVSAWWLEQGLRRTQQLPPEGSVESIPSLGRDDAPAFVRWTFGATNMQVYVVRDRSAGLGEPIRRPWLPLAGAQAGTEADPLPVRYARTSQGGLIAWSHWSARERSHRLRIWRADSLLHGEFRLAYDSSANALEDLELESQSGRLSLGPLVSDDDGRSWGSPVARWR